MINDEKNRNLSEDEINEIARKYSEAKKVGDKNLEKNYMVQLYNFLYAPTVLHKKLCKQLNASQDKLNHGDDELSDFFMEYVLKYDFEKNKDFVAYCCTYMDFYLKNKFKKQYKKINAKASQEKKTYNSEEVTNEGNEKKWKKREEFGDDIKGFDTDNYEDTDDSYANFEIMYIVRTRLPSVIINFYKHNIGKAANEKRLSYYRIFFTEDIITLISESGHTKYFNKSETYECSDKNYVKFISYSKYDKLEDILSLRYKKYSDVFENYSGNDKELKVPCEEKVISEYRFRSGLDKKKKPVSKEAVSQQKGFYKKQLSWIMSDIK
ncbi:hypothetical protein [Ruminococcus flavefaciens]|uniref:hypothetical protein n=1 Tax=Ruminococcus flavefaciens TaxID=1265 RepID=UPI000463A3B6|nr:hypothetical protein [Ruminococcus flavefaciens]